MALELSNPSSAGLLNMTPSLVNGLTALSVHFRFMYQSTMIFGQDVCVLGDNFAVKLAPQLAGTLIFLSREGTTSPALKTLNMSTSAGTWYSLVGTYANGVLASDMKAYLDGVELTSTGSASDGSGSAIAPDASVYLSAPDTSPGANQKMRFADFGIWNVVLTAADAAALGAGASCRSVRQSALRFYAPLVRDVVDLRGASAIVQNDGVAYDHPRVFRI